MSDARKQYVTPEISRVMLEDRRVVAMAACKTPSPDSECATVPGNPCIIDTIPCLEINPS
jgi:hypothetical protein